MLFIVKECYTYDPNSLKYEVWRVNILLYLESNAIKKRKWEYFDLIFWLTLNFDPVTFASGLTFSLWFYWLHLNEGLGSVRFTVELDDVKGLFQTKWFCDSMVLWINEKRVMLLYFPRKQADWLNPMKIHRCLQKAKQKKQDHVKLMMK